MIINCDFCNKEIYRKPSDIKKNRKNYCSRECYGNHKKITCIGKNNNFYGKTHTKKTKQKISDANTGRIHNTSWNSGISNYKKGGLPRIIINGKRMLLSRYTWLKNNPGKKIQPSHVIHHIDLNPYNNDISNLKKMNSIKHKKLHIILMKAFINNKK